MKKNSLIILLFMLPCTCFADFDIFTASKLKDDFAKTTLEMEERIKKIAKDLKTIDAAVKKNFKIIGEIGNAATVAKDGMS